MMEISYLHNLLLDSDKISSIENMLISSHDKNLSPKLKELVYMNVEFPLENNVTLEVGSNIKGRI